MEPRGLSFHPHATFTEDRTADTVTASMTLSGGPEGKAVSLQVFPDQYLPFANTPYTVSAAAPRSYTWDATRTDGKYAFSVYGPDGFLRSFMRPGDSGEREQAARRPSARRGGAGQGQARRGPAEAAQRRPSSRPLHPQGQRLRRMGTRKITVPGGHSTVVNWPTERGYYDVVLTADTGTGWTQRYAGRVATL